jgi:hypothetical protein
VSGADGGEGAGGRGFKRQRELGENIGGAASHQTGQEAQTIGRMHTSGLRHGPSIPGQPGDWDWDGDGEGMLVEGAVPVVLCLSKLLELKPSGHVHPCAPGSGWLAAGGGRPAQPGSAQPNTVQQDYTQLAGAGGTAVSMTRGRQSAIAARLVQLPVAVFSQGRVPEHRHRGRVCCSLDAARACTGHARCSMSDRHVPSSPISALVAVAVADSARALSRRLTKRTTTPSPHTGPHALTSLRPATTLSRLHPSASQALASCERAPSRAVAS